MPIRWGIASCCRASQDFANALKSYPETQHQLTAVAAKNVQSLEAFASTFDIPQTYNTYIDLATDENVDIVYVAVHNGMHVDVVRNIVNGGKHVVCEKPLCFNEKSAKELMVLAKVKGVFLMEAMWTKCFPGWEYLTNLLAEGVIGEVNFSQVTFGHSDYNQRNLNLKSMYKGSVMDFGIHALCFQEQIFQNLVPVKVLTTGFIGDQDVDESASCILSYAEGKNAIISTHTRCSMPNEAIIVGSKGIIRIPHFWYPTRLYLPDGEEKKFDLPNRERIVTRIVGFKYLIKEVQYCLERNMLESEKHSHASTLTVIHWMDIWRKQLQVIYEQDS
ncbi:trans-1,2-dihydrobenzene-1,2-diol dehydrogenase-like [Aethina tumida]|uniref:trans-1,2-dihydrobenzene-1,2-diol dehydrogenase-like n=1 Tax=Aethina tumida TaxID=116153 RepID=UPI00096ADFBB|nr:trans-1,2-dihydrobenzene-1,2-diol dehydrogenase-like [Aethina tumida]